MSGMNKDQLKAWKEKRRKRKQSLNHNDLLKAILAGDVGALSSGITLLGSNRIEDKKTARKLVTSCLPYSGKSVRLGITGVPGVGKSTFIESFGQVVVEKGHKLAVLAVDPSSEISGGSILGDKTRMTQLSVLENAFIRPSPAGKSLGGVARKTRESIILCEAAGYDFILDRKSTRLNSSHVRISYAVFCLKKKIQIKRCLIIIDTHCA